jgi:hypothetical protein
MVCLTFLLLQMQYLIQLIDRYTIYMHKAKKLKKC